MSKSIFGLGIDTDSLDTTIVTDDTLTDVTTWKPSSYGSSYTVTIPDSLLTTSGMVYVTDGNTYTVTTEDGTTVELNVKGNCVTVNGYRITTETIKNAIKKIQEEEERL